MNNLKEVAKTLHDLADMNNVMAEALDGMIDTFITLRDNCRKSTKAIREAAAGFEAQADSILN